MTLNQRQVIDQWRGTEEHWDVLIGVICIIGIVACVPEVARGSGIPSEIREAV